MQTSSTLPDKLGSSIQNGTLDLGELFPPLRRYCPLVDSISPQQALFLLLDCEEAFYGGAAGGGKSAALLMAALQYVDKPGYSALILRRTFPQLSQPGMLIPLSREWLGASDAKWSEQQSQWTFPSGAVLRFGHVSDEGSIYNYQGGAYSFVGFDELTQFSESMYQYIGFSRVRRDKRLQAAGVPNRVRSTANPGGIGHAWVKKRFIDNPTPGTIFIPAKVKDNPGLDVEDYVSRLQHLGETLRAQLLDGDWGAFEGAAFPDFDERIHCIPAFQIPEDWSRFESLDHGIANPTCCLLWTADYDGNLIIADSYYSQQNTMISAHAEALKEKRANWWPKDEKGWLKHSITCYADHDLWQTSGIQNRWGEPASLLSEYAEAGVEGFIRANKGRKEGRARLLELMRPDPERMFPRWHPRYGEFGSPRLFVVASRCPELVEQIKGAPTNEKPVGDRMGAGEATDPTWESAHGHATAALRYGAMSWREATPEPVTQADDPRRAFLDRAMNERQREAAEL